MRFSARPYQAMAIERMVKQPALLLALPMGAGKSVVCLSAVQELMFDRFEVSKVLVVAPLRVAELVWASEAGKWDHLQGLRVERVLGDRRQRLEALSRQADVQVINRENFPWLVELVEESGEAWPWDCVVLDELVGFRDRASKAWKALKRVRGQVKRLYMLSGTPAPNSLLELWAPVSMLDGGVRLGRSLTAYRDRWFQPDKRNGMVVYSWKLRRGAEQEIYAAVSDVMLSVEAGIELPERIDNIVPVAVGAEAVRRMAEIEQTMVTGNVSASSAGVLAGKLAQMANGAVYDDGGEVEELHPAKLDALEEIVDQGEPVLCFITYRHDWSRIKARFGGARLFDGEDSLKAWKAGKVDLLVMHPASGGHGVDGLQLGGNTVVWFGLPFSLDLYQQANARLHRSGQKQGVVVHHLVAQGTIDERVMQVLAAKGDMQAALLDAVRAVAKQGVAA